MPLLLCPNDNTAMTTVSRSGVDFDMCPTCRGVWLDRGELEKLMAADGPAETSRPAPYTGAPPPRPSEYRDDRPRYDDDYRGGYRKKKSSLFDIFD